jgi:hypothetical protein
MPTWTPHIELDLNWKFIIKKNNLVLLISALDFELDLCSIYVIQNK